MYLTMWQLVTIMGIPTALTTFCFGLIQWKIEKRDRQREEQEAERRRKEEEQEKARENMELLNVKATLASITLAEATARAVERIPDAHCNGDMHSALEYATGIKHDVRDFLAAQATRAVVK